MELTVAICDDNKIALNDEARAIAKTLREKNINNIIDKFDNPISLLNSSTSYDIVFLDIEMDGLNGIETAKKLKSKNSECLVIFITNYWGYLDNAFDVHAFRYWKKPLDEQKLKAGIDLAVKELNDTKQTIKIKIRSGDVEILSKNILYVYVSNKIACVVLGSGEIHIYDTYKSVSERLTALGSFGEPYRGYCVNFAYVHNYTPDRLICSYQDKLYELNVSRRKYEEFDKAFTAWLGGKR